MGSFPRRVAPAFLVLGLLAASPARAGFTLYGITSGAPGNVAIPGQLITIDPTTGAGTAVGTLDSAMGSYGLAVQNGKLYTYDQVSGLNTFRQLDPATGHTLNSINAGTGALVGEGDIEIRPDGTGFLSSAQGRPFITFNLSAGTSSVIASGGLLFDGLAFNRSNVLFGLTQADVGGRGSSLYTIDATTGAASLIGALNVPAAAFELVGGLAFAPDGTLYADLSDGSTTSSLYRVDTTTGQAALVGSIGFGNVSGIRFLASPSAAVPEPSSLALCGVAGLAVLGRAWRRKRAAA